MTGGTAAVYAGLMTFKRLFKWLTLLSLAALFAALLARGLPDGVEAWVGLMLLFAWMGGPIALSYLVSSGDTDGSGRLGLFLFFLLAAGLTAWTFGAVRSDNSTAAIDLFFVPVYTWAGLIATAFATAAMTGWRPSLSAPAESLPPRSPPPG